MVYRFSSGEVCADIEISDTDFRQINTAMQMRGFRMTERNPGAPKQRRLTAEEVGAMFYGPPGDQVRGPGVDGRSEPVGVVAGDIRIRGGLAIQL